MEAVESTSRYLVTERRIAQLTLALGALAAVASYFAFSLRVGAGVLAGSVLAWVNFRWLKGAVDALAMVSTASPGSNESRMPLGPMFLLFGRYSLIAIAVCVTFYVFKIPVLSILAGLCALGAATILASLYEILHSTD